MALAGYIYWAKRLRTVGIPVAQVLHADFEKVIFPFAYLILERLEGTDLGQAYPGMSPQAKTALARRIAELQSATLGLPQSTSFGDSLCYDEPAPHRSWPDFVGANIATCRNRAGGNSLLTTSNVADLERAAASVQQSLSSVEPLPFLDDITSSNVIVRPDSYLSGIVDVDTLCFGDFLFPLALTRAAFTKLGYDTQYTDAWESALQLNTVQCSHLHLYTTLFAAILLSESGITFNRSTGVSIDSAGVERLKQLFNQELQKVL